mmetsp:Transcript_40732/g.73581  ORF Transcript_40732/g.73581 Transcript_40732/m.73581 type:complete len:378 (+) Transcript_40732:43-1176(+)
MATSDSTLGQLALLFGGCCARVKSTPSSPTAKADEPALLEIEETLQKLPDDDLPAQVLSARRHSLSTPHVEADKDSDERLPGDGSCSTIFFVGEACEPSSVQLDASWTSEFLWPSEALEDGIQLDALEDHDQILAQEDTSTPQPVIDDTRSAPDEGGQSEFGLEDTAIIADAEQEDDGCLPQALLDLEKVELDEPDHSSDPEAAMQENSYLYAEAETSIALDADDDFSFHDCLELLDALDTSSEGGFEDALEEEENSAPLLRWRFITSRMGNKTITEKEFQFFEECLRGLNASIAYHGIEFPLDELDLDEAEETVRHMLQEWFRRALRQYGDSLFVERRRFMSFGSIKVLELFLWCAPVEQMYLSVEWPWNVRVESA